MVDTAWRADETKIQLPKIPVTPIGYDDAIMYLEKMSGDVVNDSWKGGLEISYRYGPGFAAPFQNRYLRHLYLTQVFILSSRVEFINKYKYLNKSI